MSSRKDGNSDRGEGLLNKTVDDDYVSELQKRNTASSNKRGQEKGTKPMKTILIVFWILVFLGGLIAVIVSLSKRGGHNIEDKQDYNMFKVKGHQETLQMVTVELESKLKNPSANEGEER